jgi:chromate transporter
MAEERRDDAQAVPHGTAAEVFAVFLRLGLTSFGGPIAHLGYFRSALVERRGWLSEAAYAELVGLCQVLPGPSSSQTGFAIGLLRAGLPGALAAFLGFTLPSALLMLGIARLGTLLAGPAAVAVVHALKLVAVAIVAQAVIGMARNLTPDVRRAAIAAGGAAIALLAGGGAGQLGAIGFGALAGAVLCRGLVVPAGQWVPAGVSRRLGVACLGLAGLLLVALPVLASRSAGLALFDIFYRAGALVFGGGHVVLPLLRVELVPEWMGASDFLAGYGAAQALPGPLFAVAGYLGAIAGGGVAGALVALAGIFLPGLLLVVGVLPFWAVLRGNRLLRAAIAGVNAAVVGILALALYDPLWTGSVGSWVDMALIALALLALLRWGLSPLVVVAALVGAAVLLA